MGKSRLRANEAQRTRARSAASIVHVGGVGTEPFRRPCRRALALEHLGATNPSLRHPGPCHLARGIARELGHSLAVSGVPEKFLGWIHGPVLLMVHAARDFASWRKRSAYSESRSQHRASSRHVIRSLSSTACSAN